MKKEDIKKMAEKGKKMMGAKRMMNSKSKALKKMC